MYYLSQMLKTPVVDAAGEELGRISDLAIASGEVFPRVTSLAFKGPGNTPMMISWRKYVDSFDDDSIRLNVAAKDVRFSYLQPDEVLLSRDLMSKQIVDTQGLKVVRVNDLKLSDSASMLRLLGAEVGVRGILRGLAPWIEKVVCGAAGLLHHEIAENIIAWSYMDLLDRDLSQVKLSVTHKRLHELHPADVADIIEQLDPSQRASVFEHLDNAHAAEAISELEDEYQSGIIEGLSDKRASTLLAQMDPDDAADIIGDLPYDKAETLLRIMGVSEARAIRGLLGYKDKTAGGIMTTEFFAVPEGTTVGETIERLRSLPEDHEPVSYVYVTDAGKLAGVISMRTLVLARNDASVSELAYRDLITANPDDDQEQVANEISKYSIMAMPVVDEDDRFLGIVTFDDAFDVLEEEHNEDLAIAGAARSDTTGGPIIEYFQWFLQRNAWFYIWAFVALVLSVAGGFETFMGALIVLPLVLMVADGVGVYANSVLIDYEDEPDLTIGNLIGRHVLTGILTSVMFAVILGVVAGISSTGDTPMIFQGIHNAILPTAITLLAVIICTAPLATFSSRRRDKGKIISSTRLSMFAMVFATVLLFALSWGFVSLGVVF